MNLNLSILELPSFQHYTSHLNVTMLTLDEEIVLVHVFNRNSHLLAFPINYYRMLPGDDIWQ